LREIEIAMDWKDPNSYFSHKNLYRFTDAPLFTNNYMAHSIFTSHYNFTILFIFETYLKRYIFNLRNKIIDFGEK
jgi:hypothetical protein